MTREQNDKEGPIEEQDIESSEEISYTSDDEEEDADEDEEEVEEENETH